MAPTTRDTDRRTPWAVMGILLLAIVLPGQQAQAATEAGIPAAMDYDCTAQAEVSEAECNALVALYDATDGDNWTNNTNWLTGNISTWSGVTVDAGQITDLSLDGRDLAGVIPAELGDLVGLQILGLDENQLTGPIPSTLGQLTNLQFLFLGFNQLTGPIPPELGNLANLQNLQLRNNQLTGSLPPELGDLTNLIQFQLSQNQLSGNVPGTLGDLANLIQLDVDNNPGLTGALPLNLTNLSNLTNFRFNNTDLCEPDDPGFQAWLDGVTTVNSTGVSCSAGGGGGAYDCTTQAEIPQAECEALVALYEATDGDNWTTNAGWLAGPPSSWAGVTVNGGAVTVLVLANNNLVGTIPSELGDLSSVQEINFWQNQLNGSIPAELSQLSNLQSLDLGSNNLGGAIPAALGQLTNLQRLLLFNNSLSGAIPAELGQLANLQEINFWQNQLGGAIPAELGQLANLIDLQLHENQLSGTIPSQLGDLSNLQFLYLGTNNLAGPLPDELSQLGSLEQLFVNDTNLTGPIPLSYTNLGALTLFYFNGTDLCEPDEVAFQAWLDGIPAVLSTNETCTAGGGGGSFDCVAQASVSVSECEALVALYNATDGPNWTFNDNWLIEADIDSWQGVGTHLGGVELLSLGDRNMNGTLPPEMGNLVNLETLYLHDNQLSGPLPPEMGQLANLAAVTLQNNQLTGPIPATFGNLANLQSMSLVNNQLSGPVPPELGQLPIVRVLGFQNNQLTGPIPPELGQLATLTFLNLDNNAMSGMLPEELGQLASLKGLTLDGNNFTGSIPLSFTNLGELTQFHFNDTGLCEPNDAGFQAWLGAIGNVQSTNLVCGTTVAEQDSLALVALYNATNGANWTDNTNWLTGSVSTWVGVSVAGGRVVGVNLPDNGLMGSLPAALNGLTALQALLLNDNQLSGSIPAELGQLAVLQSLRLDQNQLTGALPTELGQLLALEALNVSDNQLSGMVPSALGNLTNLEFLLLSTNAFEGPLPLSFTNLTSLTTFFFDATTLCEPDDAAFQTWLTGVTTVVGTGETCTTGGGGGGSYDCAGQAEVPVAECEALVAFYNATNGDNWADNTGWLTGAISSWFGVFIQEGSVSAISMNGNQVGGSLPPEIGDFANMRTLGLQSNQVTGLLPPELGNLANLTRLFLDGNQLSGPLPAELGNLTSLTDMGLGSNAFSGPVPPELGNLTTLTYLSLGGNELTGSLPPELGNLTNLTGLFLSSNQLSGPIPSGWWNLTNLINLSLSGNQLSGSLPPEMGNLTDLTGLFLGNNQFSGSLPVELGNLTNLVNLSLSGNQFSGPLPVELGNLTSLTGLGLTSNAFSGPVPSELGNLANLGSLFLSFNPLEGALPLSLVGLPLNSFWFNETGLCEPADESFQVWLATISDVRRSDLVCEEGPVAAQDSLALVALYNATDGANWINSENWMSGPVSSWFGVVTNAGRITELYLQGNNLTGLLPADLTQLTALEVLHLEDNPNIGGTIPEDIGNLTNLLYLDMGRCSLSGTLPASLGNLTNLQTLGLAVNSLNGPLLPEIGTFSGLINLWLDNNQFSGPLPAEWAGLTSLTRFYIQFNSLSGAIPDMFGNMPNLQELWLADNQFSGAVPPSYAQLQSLMFTSVAVNALDGLPDLSGLPNLVDLYVNNNRLTFEDLVPNAGAPSNLFVYAPQDTMPGTPRTEVVNAGEARTLDATMGGTGNSYQWFKDGEAITDATEATYTINAADQTDAGVYTVDVSNAALPDIVFSWAPVTVAVPMIETDPPPVVDAGTEVPISFDVGGFEATERLLFYRQSGALTYQSIPLQANGTALAANIPASLVTARGVDYYLYLSDGEAVVTYPANDPENNPIHLPVSVAMVNAGGSFAPAQYRMVSVPLNLAQPGLLEVLGDDLGTYDENVWRLLRWNAADGAYREYPDLSATFTPGTAFWLITRNGTAFQTGAGQSVDASEPYTLSLPPGWSQISTPFAFPVAWANITVSGRVEAPVGFNGTDYQYEQAILQPWQGYFVYNDAGQTVTLTIPPVEATTAAAAKTTDAPLPSYTLRLAAETTDGAYRDAQNVLGFRAGATDRRDPLDVSEAPPIGPSLRLSIMAGEEPLAYSFKPEGTAGATWDVAVEVPWDDVLATRQHVRVQLIEDGVRPDGFTIEVLDLDHGGTLPVTSNGSVMLTFDERDAGRHLRVLVGTEAFLHEEAAQVVPHRAGLDGLYPNPFLPAAASALTVRYQVPEPEAVSVMVFDALGRRVQTLAEGVCDAGSHEVMWDGRDGTGRQVASGTYFVRFQTGAFVTTRSVLLVR